MVNIDNKYCNFNYLKLKSSILDIIYKLGYKKPTDIQFKCIPYFLKGYDILGIAKTGSGKTAAFVLPIINNIVINYSNIQVLILAPTRELNIQITNIFKVFSKYNRKIKILSLYGGQKYNIQILGLRKKPHIIVATPGRLLDYLRKKMINISSVKFLVIDEADEMLRMGFIKDVELIISYIKSKHQTALFSATMPLAIKRIVGRFMNKPKEIILNLSKDNILPENIQQYYCLVNSWKNKLNVLMKFLEIENYSSVIIFVSTKLYTIKLSSIIEKWGYSCSAFNGDMNQKSREKILYDLKKSKISILVATDVASRGLDIKNISLVINYDLPTDIESYIHRIGRTGRAGKYGRTILFLNFKNKKFLFHIERHIKSKIKKINIPDNNFLVNYRINKLTYLIKNNFYKNSNKRKFYSNFLDKILEFSKLNNRDISISLLDLFYSKKYLNIY